MLHTGVRGLSGFVCCLAFSVIVACDDDECSEPDPRGAGSLGESCITTRDCSVGLTCFGQSMDDQALCIDPVELPGGEDPGCLEHPDAWIGHEMHGADPPTTDDNGCVILQFVSGCDCIDNATIGECIPLGPFYREETWRSCNDCCWRLISFWEDVGICDEIDG